MRHFAFVLMVASVFTAAGSGPPAGATVLRGRDLQTLCDESTQILRGQVVRLAPEWRGGRIVTEVILRVEAPLFGHVRAGGRVSFWVLGGEVGGLGQRVVGEAQFQRSERVVVFLQRRAGRLTVSGMVQGKFRVLTPSAPGEPVRVSSSVDGLSLRGGGHPLKRPMALADFEAEVRLRVKHRLGTGAPVGPRRHP